MEIRICKGTSGFVGGAGMGLAAANAWNSRIPKERRSSATSRGRITKVNETKTSCRVKTFAFGQVIKVSHSPRVCSDDSLCLTVSCIVRLMLSRFSVMALAVWTACSRLANVLRRWRICSWRVSEHANKLQSDLRSAAGGRTALQRVLEQCAAYNAVSSQDKRWGFRAIKTSIFVADGRTRIAVFTCWKFSSEITTKIAFRLPTNSAFQIENLGNRSQLLTFPQNDSDCAFRHFFRRKTVGVKTTKTIFWTITVGGCVLAWVGRHWPFQTRCRQLTTNTFLLCRNGRSVPS